MITKSEHQPSLLLQSYLSHITIVETSVPFTFTTLPQTTPVMAFHFRGAMFLKTEHEEKRLATNGLFGIHNSFRKFRCTGNTSFLSVHFTATGASAFFKFPLHEIALSSVALNELMPSCRISAIEERLRDAISNQERVHIIEHFLLSLLQEKKTDDTIGQAIHLIKKNNGNLSIRQLAQNLYLSESTFEKRFRQSVGISAKKYASIIRIKSLINREKTNDKLVHLAYEAGYFDQSHLIRDFKSFTGTTPAKFFASLQQPQPEYLLL